MATRFWVGGTGTWDASDTTHWAATTGGAGSQSVPSSADTVTFDASSGGGTVTVNTTVTVTSVTMGAFTGTLDFSINNNNVTLTATTGFSGTGTGTRTLKMGNGTWSLSAVAAVWDCTTTTNMTLVAGGSTIVLSSTAIGSTRAFHTGGLTYNNVTISGSSPTKGFSTQFLEAGATISGTLSIPGGNNVLFAAGSTLTIGTLSVVGTASLPVGLFSSSTTSIATVAVTTATIDNAAIRLLTFTGGPSATNSFDLGSNTGVTITAPSEGGGSSGYSAARAYLGVN